MKCVTRRLSREFSFSNSFSRLACSGISPYEYYRHLIISIDFAKGDRRKPQLLEHCPDLVIVDEVHGAADPGYQGSKEQQQRHELLKQIATDGAHHLLMLSATPHSGIEESFRSLLGLIRPEFRAFDLQELTETQRRDLARHIVQRRRGDIDEKWLKYQCATLVFYCLVFRDPPTRTGGCSYVAVCDSCGELLLYVNDPPHEDCSDRFAPLDVIKPAVVSGRQNGVRGGLARAELYGPEKLSEWARQGGIATRERHGNDYYRRIRQRRKQYRKGYQTQKTKERQRESMRRLAER